MRAELERQGNPIRSLDLLIAAQALNRGITLVTNNRGEFERVDGLAMENWAS
ncbi:MAG: type II toxin-antitoxin system VapC family toxin [Synechococcales cyanobacterium RU_4_20]|nr:type II toxin-antitoxin system VapC family toxin [Synechococcales cyanobacterium RU_4_20]